MVTEEGPPKADGDDICCPATGRPMVYRITVPRKGKKGSDCYRCFCSKEDKVGKANSSQFMLVAGQGGALSP